MGTTQVLKLLLYKNVLYVSGHMRGTRALSDATSLGLQLAERIVTNAYIIIGLYTHFLKEFCLVLINVFADVVPVKQGTICI